MQYDAKFQTVLAKLVDGGTGIKHNMNTCINIVNKHLTCTLSFEHPGFQTGRTVKDSIETRSLSNMPTGMVVDVNPPNNLH